MHEVSKSIKKVQERGAKNTWLRVTYLVPWLDCADKHDVRSNDEVLKNNSEKGKVDYIFKKR